MLATLALFVPLAFPLALQDLPELVVRADDTRVERSARLVVPEGLAIEDVNGDGVVHVVADGVRIEFAPGSVLRGAPDARDPDALTGCGIRVAGHRGVVIAGARVRGFKVGIHASSAPGLVVEDADVSDNFRQRLRSSPAAEEGADWLWPHENDTNEWLVNYGAGVWIEDSPEVSVRRVRARNVQNGIVLDRVERSRVVDCDCSFLSGWGLALWRSSDNVITRNALDFCVRGYSHGIYNRGQDSAGLLMFEQCSRNVVAENSITHGGDGVFAFAGREALGEHAAPEGFDHARKGCNANLFEGNDLSYAAAHGLELTFSFDNVIRANRFVENSICGIWGGYSQSSAILANEFRGNGGDGYGGERGGVNVEHGRGNTIAGNRFAENACGVRLWWDEDEGLAALPWARANGTASAANRIQDNVFERDQLAIELRGSQDDVLAGNRFVECGVDLVEDPQAARTLDASPPLEAPALEGQALGDTRPVGARAALAGREHIVMTEWGPWDHASPLVLPLPTTSKEVGMEGDEKPLQLADHCAFVLLGFEGVPEVRVLSGDVKAVVFPALRSGTQSTRLLVAGNKPGVVPFQLELAGGGLAAPRTVEGVLKGIAWDVTWFAWTADPREELEAWRAEASGETAITQRLTHLGLVYGGGGPAELDLAVPEARAGLPSDGFGMIARAKVEFPAGRWRFVARSDDGVRVTADGAIVLENWTWHGPMRDEGLLELESARAVELAVEHFELDGHAELALDIEPAD